jgi:ADP-heptose:LPS heptosyltransferase
MKVLSIKGLKPLFKLDQNRTVTLEENKKYIVADYLVDMLKRQVPEHLHKQTINSKDVYTVFSQYKGQDLNNRNLFILRTGGIGDLIFIIPCALHLKQKYPTSRIFLVCAEKNGQLFNGLKGVAFNDVLAMPLAYEDAVRTVGYPISRASTYLISFEGMIETLKDAEEMNVFDLHKKQFGITEDIDLKPVLYLEGNDEELTKKYNVFDEKGNRQYLDIGFQFSASAPIRTWRPDYIVKFFNLWDIPNTRFYIFDSPYKKDFINKYMDRITNENVEFVKVYEMSESLVESARLVKFMQAMIAPDSSMAHIAGCFNIPIVALFGAFPTELRLKYYNKVVGINAMSDCPYAKKSVFKSCFAHGNICPRAQIHARYFSPCMDLLLPEKVMGYTYSFLKKLGLVNGLK